MPGRITFSVVIPLYNKAPHIAAAIDSILAQDRPPDEIIVVNDASTDGGDRIAVQYGDSRIRTLRREIPGPGGYAARNLGIAEARGRWIAFLDADDIWLPNHLSELAMLVDRFPDAGMAATRYRHVFARGSTSDVVAPLLRTSSHLLDFRTFVSAWVNAGHCPVWTSATAVRRDLLLPDQGFPAGKALRGGDKELWLRMARAAPLAFSSAFTAEFHRQSSNKVTDSTDTRGLPRLVPTARLMRGDASGRERRLLRRLINLEIGLYARWGARVGQRSRVRLRDLAFPPEATPLMWLLAVHMVPRFMLPWPARIAQVWRKRRAAPP